MERIVTWLGHNAKPTELVVDWGLGFLKSKGYNEIRESDPVLETPPHDTIGISEKGLDLVKHFEGMKLKAYFDIAGVLTIGYGHTKNVTLGQTITESEAHNILIGDLQEFAKGVRYQLGNNLPQQHFDALVSFSFNCGLGALSRSTVKKRYLAGNYSGAADALLMWNKYTDPKTGTLKEAPGLTRRRKSERHLFLNNSLNFFQ